LDIKEPQITSNFFALEVDVLNKHFHILLNAKYPFLAFAFKVNFKEINIFDVIIKVV